MNAQTCRGCGEQIVWFKTDAGKNMPVNVESVEKGDEQLDLKRHVSHFSTCPAANTFRKSK